MAVIIGIVAAVLIAGLIWFFVMANGTRTKGKTFAAQDAPPPQAPSQTESRRVSGID